MGFRLRPCSLCFQPRRLWLPSRLWDPALLSAEWIVLLEAPPAVPVGGFHLTVLTLTLRLFWSPRGTAMCRGNSSVAPTALIWLNTSGSIKISFGRLRWSAVTGARSSRWSRPAALPLLAIPLLQFDASSNMDPKAYFQMHGQKTDRKVECNANCEQLFENEK